MYLHEDKETFKEIIEQVADDTGCAAVVIEKDYYVTMIKIPETMSGKRLNCKKMFGKMVPNG